jgi:hypothetical protein
LKFSGVLFSVWGTKNLGTPVVLVLVNSSQGLRHNSICDFVLPKDKVNNPVVNIKVILLSIFAVGEIDNRSQFDQNFRRFFRANWMLFYW